MCRSQSALVSRKRSPPARPNSMSELNQPAWAVVSFGLVWKSRLTYVEAYCYAKDLKACGTSAVVVTNEAAERIRAVSTP